MGKFYSLLFELYVILFAVGAAWESIVIHLDNLKDKTVISSSSAAASIGRAPNAMETYSRHSSGRTATTTTDEAFAFSGRVNFA